MNAFTDLKITGLDTELTRPSERASGLRQMFLRLSDSPPSEWQELFEAERQFPRHSMWRDAWIEGDHIVVDCVPEEIERYHLNDLKQDVSSVNQKFRDFLTRVQRQREQQHRAEQSERDQLNSIRDRLNFD